jgi:hypothetical protein
MSLIMTSPQLPASEGGDSGQADEALRRVQQGGKGGGSQ